MPKQGKAEKLLGRAFTKRGIWFKPQITVKIDTRSGEWKRQIDFMLRRPETSKQKRLVIEINGADNHKDVNKKVDATLKGAGYAVYRVDANVVIKGPDTIVKSIVNNFKPLRVSEVNRSVQGELREVRKMLKVARDAEEAAESEAGNDVTKPAKAAGKR